MMPIFDQEILIRFISVGLPFVHVSILSMVSPMQHNGKTTHLDKISKILLWKSYHRIPLHGLVKQSKVGARSKIFKIVATPAARKCWAGSHSENTVSTARTSLYPPREPQAILSSTPELGWTRSAGAGLVVGSLILSYPTLVVKTLFEF